MGMDDVGPTWDGKRIDDLTRDEAVAALKDAIRRLTIMHQQHIGSIIVVVPQADPDEADQEPAMDRDRFIALCTEEGMTSEQAANVWDNCIWPAGPAAIYTDVNMIRATARAAKKQFPNGETKL